MTNSAATAHPKRVVFLINSLTDGGAERIMMLLLAGLEQPLSAHEVHLVLLDHETARHTTPPYVRVHQLNAKGSLPKSIIQLFGVLSRLSPALVVSFLERSNVANVVCRELLHYPSVLSLRIHATSHLGKGLAGKVKRLLVRLTYPRTDRLISVSSGAKDDLVANYGVPAERIVVIGNPVELDRIVARASEPKKIATPVEYAVAVGRLVQAKNFALLIEAFARTPGRHLVILGEGPERSSLERLARARNVADRIHLPGYVANPYPVIAGAMHFVSASNAEGFPNALIEAMCLGRPVIATDCPTGPAEILSGDGDLNSPENIEREFGLLVPTNALDPMIRALAHLVDPCARETYSRKALERARSFAAVDSARRYLDVIGEFVEVA